MKIAADLKDFRYAGKGKLNLPDRPTALKKPLYAEEADLREKLGEFKKEIDDLQQQMYAHDRYSMLLIFQAMDAAGKDGTIRHVMSGINPHGVNVHAFKRPSEEELDHDYLWRTTKCLPARGHIGIFNRSYYEEVLVVKVHPDIVTGVQRLPEDRTADLKKLWKHRYRQIADFERALHENGTPVVKFFLNVSADEQKKRFLDRIDEPKKNWKFNEGDVKERAQWDAYMEAYADAISATATPDSPWYVVPADDKGSMRLIVSAAILQELRKLPLHWPELSVEQQTRLAGCRAALTGEGGAAGGTESAAEEAPAAVKKKPARRKKSKP